MYPMRGTWCRVKTYGRSRNQRTTRNKIKLYNNKIRLFLTLVGSRMDDRTTNIRQLHKNIDALCCVTKWQTAQSNKLGGSHLWACDVRKVGALRTLVLSSTFFIIFIFLWQIMNKSPINCWIWCLPSTQKKYSCKWVYPIWHKAVWHNAVWHRSLA